MEIENIETQRLHLKIITPEVFEQVFIKQNETQVRELLWIHSDEIYNALIQKKDRVFTNKTRSYQFFLIYENNFLVGECGFHNWFIEHKRSEMGYAIFNDVYKNKGIMTEAASAMIDFGFNRLNLNRIEACISPKNEASIKLIKRLGFTQEGLLRSHYFKNGVFVDSLIFSLLQEEYLK